MALLATSRLVLPFCRACSTWPVASPAVWRKRAGEVTPLSHAFACAIAGSDRRSRTQGKLVEDVRLLPFGISSKVTSFICVALFFQFAGLQHAGRLKLTSTCKPSLQQLLHLLLQMPPRARLPELVPIGVKNQVAAGSAKWHRCAEHSSSTPSSIQ